MERKDEPRSPCPANCQCFMQYHHWFIDSVHINMWSKLGTWDSGTWIVQLSDDFLRASWRSLDQNVMERR
jgi:hypothetical protein